MNPGNLRNTGSTQISAERCASPTTCVLLPAIGRPGNLLNRPRRLLQELDQARNRCDGFMVTAARQQPTVTCARATHKLVTSALHTSCVLDSNALARTICAEMAAT